MGPDALAQVLCHLPKFQDQRLLVGIDTSDDAAVYQLDEERSIVLTLDFFTPVVDDPYLYGEIAAANSLSDVYAMGGTPVTAMNISCFPNCLEPEVVGEILRGGAEKMIEAGVILVGGHTVEDEEPKYGLSVMGFVNNDEITPNSGAREGDLLILTKPIGLGIGNTAIKADLASDELYRNCTDVMKYLNKDSGELMRQFKVKGATDITGFGLLGHCAEVAEASGVTIELLTDRIPIIPGVVDLAKDGIIPAGRYNNEKHVGSKVRFNANLPEYMKDLLFDPQTSGGLLICIPEEQVEDFTQALALKNKTPWAVVGRVVKKREFLVEVFQ